MKRPRLSIIALLIAACASFSHAEDSRADQPVLKAADQLDPSSRDRFFRGGSATPKDGSYTIIPDTTTLQPISEQFRLTDVQARALAEYIALRARLDSLEDTLEVATVAHQNMKGWTPKSNIPKSEVEMFENQYKSAQEALAKEAPTLAPATAKAFHAVQAALSPAKAKTVFAFMNLIWKHSYDALDAWASSAGDWDKRTDALRRFLNTVSRWMPGTDFCLQQKPQYNNAMFVASYLCAFHAADEYKQGLEKQATTKPEATIEGCRFLLAKYPRFELRDTLLIEAQAEEVLRHDDTAKALRAQYDEGLFTPQEVQKSLIKFAREGNLNFVKRALLAGATIDAEVPEGQYYVSALSAAIQTGHADIVKYLLDNGASIYRADWKGTHPLVAAGQYFQLQPALYILERSTDSAETRKDLEDARKNAERSRNAAFIGLAARFPSLPAMEDWVKDVNAAMELMKARCNGDRTWQGASSDVTFPTASSAPTTGKMTEAVLGRLGELGLPSEIKDSVKVEVWDLRKLDLPKQDYFVDATCPDNNICNVAWIFAKTGEDHFSLCEEKFYAKTEFETTHCSPLAYVQINGKPAVVTSEGNSFEWFTRAYLVTANGWESMGSGCGGGD